MVEYKEKIELPVLVVAILIFLSSMGFLAFAVYYIAYLPVPVAIKPLKVRVLTVLQVEDVLRKETTNIVQEEEQESEEDFKLEDEVPEEGTLE